MNTVVLYQSRYGSTKQYAEWIAEELGADIYPADSFPAEKFAGYDTVIFGAPVFGGAVLGIAGIENNLAVLQNKRLIIFTVGLTSPDAEERLAATSGRTASRETWFWFKSSLFGMDERIIRSRILCPNESF